MLLSHSALPPGPLARAAPRIAASGAPSSPMPTVHTPQSPRADATAVGFAGHFHNLHGVQVAFRLCSFKCISRCCNYFGLARLRPPTVRCMV